jgi:methylthioribose-1-phosphate isomerase
VIRAARAQGKCISVIATETRPALQGARLTGYELQRDEIDARIIVDSAVGMMMSSGRIDKVIVGADRITSTGHVFNKIGTYQIAVLAKQHSIPFYVAAPLSTFDFESDFKSVTIEERDLREITMLGERRIVPAGLSIYNPAFDMTPPSLISAIVTDQGVLKPQYKRSILNLKSKLR